MSLGAQNIAHSGEIYAERVLLQAGQDLNIAGGKISADHAASLYAGHNLESSINDNTLSKSKQQRRFYQ